jgi:hypothetical protein
LDEVLDGGDAIFENLHATTNPTASTILKWLRFKVVRLMQYLQHSALLNNGLGLFSIVGFPKLHHTPSLTDITMETKTCTSKVDVISTPFSLAQQWVKIGKHYR